MKKKPSELIQPNIEGVKEKLFMSTEDSDDDLYLMKLHIEALAELDETLNRQFYPGEAALIVAEDISYALAAFKYENPIDLLIPSHIQKDINKIRFVPGF